MAEFEFPDIQVGTHIIVSSDPSRSDKSLGFVAKKKPKSVDALVYGGNGLFARYDLLHVTDPRCETSKDRFADGDSGVFELAESEKLMREVHAKLSALEDAQIQMIDRVAALEALVIQPSPSRRNKE